MKHILIIIMLMTWVYSCNSEYKLLKDNRPVRTIDISTYKLYQFSMYRDKSSDGDKLTYPEFTANKKPNSTVYEILYLLRDTISNKVIYLTTYSHKYLYRNSGVFNTPIYKQNLVFNDLDHIYLGKESTEVDPITNESLKKFSFYTPNGRSYAHNLHLYFTEDDEGIHLDKITNNYALKNDRVKTPYVRINEDVFSFKIVFKMVNKAYSYVPSANGDKRTTNTKNVSAILVQGTNVYLELDNFKETEGKPFFRDAVWYFEPY